jgi:phage terminase small subunit
MSKLTPKQLRFVEEYLIDSNATQAAVRAGYSAKTAHSSGPRMLDNVGVKNLIEEKQSKIVKKLTFTRESIMQDLMDIIQANKIERPNTAIKAIEVINRMTGFDIPKDEVTRTDNTFEIKIVGVSKERETVDEPLTKLGETIIKS